MQTNKNCNLLTPRVDSIFGVSEVNRSHIYLKLHDKITVTKMRSTSHTCQSCHWVTVIQLYSNRLP